MRGRRMHRATVAGVIVAGLLASGMAYALAAPGGSPGAPPPTNSVGINPAVQRWFQRHEAERIAVNDALQQVNAALPQGTTADRTAACARLQQASDAMLAALPTPKRALDAQVVAGIDEFRTGARRCLAGDLAGARLTLAAGVQARGAAENEIEEILEAPNSAVK